MADNIELTAGAIPAETVMMRTESHADEKIIAPPAGRDMPGSWDTEKNTVEIKYVGSSLPFPKETPLGARMTQQWRIGHYWQVSYYQ